MIIICLLKDMLNKNGKTEKFGNVSSAFYNDTAALTFPNGRLSFVV